jgi:hypothetical protein
MTEQPALYRPNPTLKSVEHGLEGVLFNGRWLMAPFYLGLVVGLAVLLYKFFVCCGSSSRMRQPPRRPISSLVCSA